MRLNPDGYPKLDLSTTGLLRMLRPDLGYGVGKRVADAIEGVANGVRETLHRGNRAETYQSCDQCVFNEILTGILRHQVLEKLLHVLHFVFLLVQVFHGTPGLRVPGDELRVGAMGYIRNPQEVSPNTTLVRA